MLIHSTDSDIGGEISLISFLTSRCMEALRGWGRNWQDKGGKNVGLRSQRRNQFTKLDRNPQTRLKFTTAEQNPLISRMFLKPRLLC